MIEWDFVEIIQTGESNDRSHPMCLFRSNLKFNFEIAPYVDEILQLVIKDTVSSENATLTQLQSKFGCLCFKYKIEICQFELRFRVEDAISVKMTCRQVESKKKKYFYENVTFFHFDEDVYISLRSLIYSKSVVFFACLSANNWNNHAKRSRSALIYEHIKGSNVSQFV